MTCFGAAALGRCSWPRAAARVARAAARWSTAAVARRAATASSSSASSAGVPGAPSACATASRSLPRCARAASWRSRTEETLLPTTRAISASGSSPATASMSTWASPRGSVRTGASQPSPPESPGAASGAASWSTGVSSDPDSSSSASPSPGSRSPQERPIRATSTRAWAAVKRSERHAVSSPSKSARRWIAVRQLSRAMSPASTPAIPAVTTRRYRDSAGLASRQSVANAPSSPPWAATSNPAYCAPSMDPVCVTSAPAVMARSGGIRALAGSAPGRSVTEQLLRWLRRPDDDGAPHAPGHRGEDQDPHPQRQPQLAEVRTPGAGR